MALHEGAATLTASCLVGHSVAMFQSTTAHMQPRNLSRPTSLAPHVSPYDRIPEFSFVNDRPSNPDQQVNNRTFPIRTLCARPGRSVGEDAGSGSLAYSLQSENHLRRKTPGGTIDAAYDGTFAQPFLGPPPQKQINVQKHATSVASYAKGCDQAQAFGHHDAVGANTSVHQCGYGLDVPRWPGPGLPHVALETAPMNASSYLPFAANFQSPPTQIPGGYQPVLRAYDRNVRAFCPPPVPTGVHLQLGMGWDADVLPWDYRVTPQISSAAYNSAATPNSINNASPNDALVPARRPLSQAFPSNSMEGYSPVHGGVSDAYSSVTESVYQPGFKERALLQAHRSYIDLLAHVNVVRKAHGGKRGSRDKLVVYPKPPNPQTLVTSNRSYAIDTFTKSHPAHTGWGSRLRIEPTIPPFGNYTQPPDDDQNVGNFNSNSNHHDGAMGTRNVLTVASQSPSMLAQQGCLPPSLASMPSVERPSPVTSAASSLEVLRSLCEQSGWDWIGGMLMGGCIHYGLGNYQEALTWFSKIIAIDPCHVEAITDIATTLYSLDRQDEAEQQWLRAVKLRPGFLDASEHLVGLLYRKRAREAVEIIEYVQKALRLPPTTSGSIPNDGPSYGRVTTAVNPNESVKGNLASAGFGRSGYALPGSENGRILALIHAKGTMLYGLRETDKAAQAFEEAVMISVGRRFKGIHHLVSRIHSVLSAGASSGMRHPRECMQALLLPPDKALTTARLVFSDTNGELPGLSFVSGGAPKRAAAQTTSNSLLSLAKIFQDSMSSSGTGSHPSLRHYSSGVGDILALYYLSLALQESPSTANNVGILLAGVQQGTTSPPELSMYPTLQPKILGVDSGSGLGLALSYYQYGLRLDPKHVHLHTNLGSLLKDIGQLDLAIQMYEQAVACDGTFDIALTNLANAIKDKGRVKDAIRYYKRAVQSNPNFAEAVCGLSTALNSVCDWKGRGGVSLNSGLYDRWHVDEAGMLVDGHSQGCGSGLINRVVMIARQQLQNASIWGRDILHDEFIKELAPHLCGLSETSATELEYALRNWKGKLWEGSRVVRLLERATRAALRRRYCAKYTTSEGSRTQNTQPHRLDLPANLSVPSAPTVLPFHTFTYPLGPRDIRMISQRNAIRISCSTFKSSWFSKLLYPPPPPPMPHLNVGYVSSDFNNHPLAHLMQSVFGFHAPDRVRAICYATTPSDRSSHRRKIEDEAPVFRDVSGWSSDKLVEQIIADKVHILVNLNGYTRGARNEIFAARPAPIQMSFMGFAGTLGAEWCDYILADTTAIPPETLRPWRDNVRIESVFHDGNEDEEGDWLYSENIIFCRDTFFCCDHAQSCDDAERCITWEEEQHRRWQMRKSLFPNLPDNVIILGNFNQLYKIEPTTFRCWLRILSKVPNAVLWLLRFPELGESNLRATAKLWAGQEVASRLLFTDVAPKDQHISRARVCDLFLDTPECNAHTTAADVLWSSTPLLTYPRYPYKMCSRMAASILKGALPKDQKGQEATYELIADSEDSYEQLAVRLATSLTYQLSPDAQYGEGCGRLAEIRHLLWRSKWQCALFNTRRWVSDVETAYEKAWQRWVAGDGGDIYI